MAVRRGARAAPASSSGGYLQIEDVRIDVDPDAVAVLHQPQRTADGGLRARPPRP